MLVFCALPDAEKMRAVPAPAASFCRWALCRPTWPAQAGNGPPLPALAWLYRAQTGLGAGKRPLPEGPRKAACCSPVPALLQRPCRPSAPGLQKSVCKFTFSFYCVAFDCCCCAGGFCSLAFSGHATKGMAVTGIKNILWPSLYRNSAARR